MFGQSCNLVYDLASLFVSFNYIEIDAARYQIQRRIFRTHRFTFRIGFSYLNFHEKKETCHEQYADISNIFAARFIDLFIKFDVSIKFYIRINFFSDVIHFQKKREKKRIKQRVE